MTWRHTPVGRGLPRCEKIGCCRSPKYQVPRTRMRMLRFVLRPSSFVLPRRQRNEPSGGVESAFPGVFVLCTVGVRFCAGCGTDKQYRADGVLSNAVTRCDVGALLFGGGRVRRCDAAFDLRRWDVGAADLRCDAHGAGAVYLNEDERRRMGDGCGCRLHAVSLAAVRGLQRRIV